MTNNQEGPSVPRLRVVDTKGIEFKRSNRKKRRSKRYNTDCDTGFKVEKSNEISHLNTEKQWPLEASPILRSVLEYGRRTASLSALDSARTLSSLAQKIRNLGNMSRELEQIVIETENEASRLRLTSEHVYENDE